MKKIILFGASGTVGIQLLQQSLDMGYEVTAFCRNTDKLSNITHPHLHKISGDVFRPEDVNKAIEGHDTVIVALGSGKSRKSIVRSAGTKNIIEAMKTHGIKRLICQSTLGAKESNDNLNFFWKHIMFGWFLKQVFEDHELQETYVEKSGLNWTIIRPGAFTDGQKTEKYRHGFSTNDRSVRLKISRADVAHFILQQINSDHYLFQRPGLSY